MANLEEIRASAERLVTAVSDALRLEIAIFDDSSNLFFCTPTYLNHNHPSNGWFALRL